MRTLHLVIIALTVMWCLNKIVTEGVSVTIFYDVTTKDTTRAAVPL